MKSLEIVNQAKEELEILINLINESIDSDYVLKNRPLAYRLLRSCELLYRYLDEDIKQDLEAWETIKKNLLRSKYGVYESKSNEVVEYNKITMREIKEDEFDREEFNKIKKWLEENE